MSLSRSRRALLRDIATLIPALFGLRPAMAAETPPPAGRPLRIIALGDSLTAGYLLPANDGFTAVLEKALRKDGYNATIVNAGVSGDTAEGGLARLDWALGDGADGVIVELGANDMLRGLDPDLTRQSLDKIMAKLADRHIKIFIAGMLASPNVGETYKKAFDAIYPDLSAKYKAPLYPFFLQGVATDKSLTLPDGLHPNAAGVVKIVAGILPMIENFLHTIA